MSELKEYTTPEGTTLLLSDEHAKMRGLTGGKARDAEVATPPANTDGSPEQTAARAGLVSTPVTKARGTLNK